MTTHLSAAEARRIFLHAQGLAGGPEPGVSPLLDRLGAVQLDTISVLARSHELVPYARLGPVGRPAVEGAYWSRPAGAFEYWAHEACVLPMGMWPWFAFRRRRFRARLRKDAKRRALQKEVLARLRAEGPATASDLGGSRKKAGWWRWTPVKRAVEDLLAMGEAACVERRGWRRVYDTAERAIPASLLGKEPSDLDCARELIARSGAALGVGTLKDLADYYRLKPALAREGLEDSGLAPVRVEGWEELAWADPRRLAKAGSHMNGEGPCRTTLLSPFDSLIWDRRRTERLFGFRYRLEAYVPAAKRVHGYFSMPLLAEGRLAGRVDPKREGNVLLVRRATLEPGAVDAMALALADAAAWVGCAAVSVAQVSPASLLRPLRKALKKLI